MAGKVNRLKQLAKSYFDNKWDISCVTTPVVCWLLLLVNWDTTVIGECHPYNIVYNDILDIFSTTDTLWRRVIVSIFLRYIPVICWSIIHWHSIHNITNRSIDRNYFQSHVWPNRSLSTKDVGWFIFGCRTDGMNTRNYEWRIFVLDSPQRRFLVVNCIAILDTINENSFEE